MTETRITFDYVVKKYETYRNPASDTLKHIKFVIAIFKKDNVHINYFSDTTKNDINCWKQTILERASEVTCNNYLRHLKVLYKFAFEEQIFNEDLFFKFKFVVVTQTAYKSISKENIREVITYLRNESNPLKPGWFWITFIKTLFYTGMRRKQIVYLRWKDIDFNKRIIFLEGISSKNKKTWDIPLHSQIYDDLLELKSKYMTAFEVDSQEDINEFQVFNVTLFNEKYTGNELKRTQVSGFFRNVYVKTGIRCGSHRYRHRITTDLVNAQRNINEIREVQYMLGHQDLKTTLTYVEQNTHKLRNSMEKEVI